MAKTSEKKDDDHHPDAMDRMNRALKEAMKTPPKPHKPATDKPKKGRGRG